MSHRPWSTKISLSWWAHVRKTLRKSALLDAPMEELVPFLLPLPLKHPESASVSSPERTYQTLTLERVCQVLAAR